MPSLCAPKDDSKKRAFDEVSEEEKAGSEEELPTVYEYLMDVFGGKVLLEVFSVVMDNKGKETRFISGTVSSEDYFWGPAAIFSAERDNPVTIKPKGRTPLLLNGPVRCILARGDIEVVVKLKDEVSGQEFDGYISIISRTWLEPRNNEPLIYRCNVDENVGEPAEFSLCDGKEEEEGSSMFVEVKLAKLLYAAPAIFEVKLIKPSAIVSTNGNANPKVYGRLYAFSECFGEDCKSVLFDQERPSESESESDSKSESESVGGNLICMNVIPLSRSVVAVPAKFNHLIVGAELYDGDGKEIAGGRAKFSVVPFSIIEKNICGEFGEICVRVTWENDPRIPATLISDSDV